jgi:CBS domain-containing protein
MRCNDIMKRDVKCLSEGDTVHTAARAMADNNIGFMPVVDDGGKVVGTVTDRDLAIRVLAANLTSATQVSEVMTREVVSCDADDDLVDAEKCMADHRKSRMLIVDGDGKPIGVISLSDIAQFEKSARAADTLRKVSERESRPS